MHIITITIIIIIIATKIAIRNKTKNIIRITNVIITITEIITTTIATIKC